MADDFWANAAKPPDDFWSNAAKPPEPKAPKTVSGTKAAALGALSGGTGGFLDELGGLLGKMFIHNPVELGAAAQPAPDDTPEVRAFKIAALQRQASAPSNYQLTRGLVRDDLAAAQAQHPNLYRAGELTGAVTTSFLPGLGVSGEAGLLGTMGKTAALGALEGLGSSDADLTRGQYGRALFDTTAGGLFGAGAGALGKGLQTLGGVASERLLGGAARKATAAEARAAELAAKAQAEEQASLFSAAGRKAQEAYKPALELRYAGKVPTLDPEARAVAERLLAEYDQKAAANLAAGEAGKQAAADALKTFMAGREEDMAGRMGNLLTPSARQSAMEIFKSYGEPLVGAYVGDRLGELTGHDKIGGTLGMLAGLIHGRTRAGKAIMSRVARPGNQLAIADGMRWLGEALANRGVDAARSSGVMGRLPGAAMGLEDSLWANPAIAGLFGGQTDDNQTLADLARNSGRSP